MSRYFLADSGSKRSSISELGNTKASPRNNDSTAKRAISGTRSPIESPSISKTPSDIWEAAEQDQLKEWEAIQTALESEILPRNIFESHGPENSDSCRSEENKGIVPPPNSRKARHHRGHSLGGITSERFFENMDFQAPQSTEVADPASRSSLYSISLNKNIRLVHGAAGGTRGGSASNVWEDVMSRRTVGTYLAARSDLSEKDLSDEVSRSATRSFARTNSGSAVESKRNLFESDDGEEAWRNYDIAHLPNAATTQRSSEEHVSGNALARVAIGEEEEEEAEVRASCGEEGTGKSRIQKIAGFLNHTLLHNPLLHVIPHHNPNNEPRGASLRPEAPSSVNEKAGTFKEAGFHSVDFSFFERTFTGTMKTIPKSLTLIPKNAMKIPKAVIAHTPQLLGLRRSIKNRKGINLSQSEINIDEEGDTAKDLGILARKLSGSRDPQSGASGRPLMVRSRSERRGDYLVQEEEALRELEAVVKGKSIFEVKEGVGGAGREKSAELGLFAEEEGWEGRGLSPLARQLSSSVALSMDLAAYKYGGMY